MRWQDALARRVGKLEQRSKFNVAGNPSRSRAEDSRLAELELFEKCGTIADLQTQVRFNVAPEGCAPIKFTVDFVYRDLEAGALIAEDCKGVLMRDAVLRMKLFCWSHPAYRLMLSRARYARIRGGTVIRDFDVFPFVDRMKHANRRRGRKRREAPPLAAGQGGGR